MLQVGCIEVVGLPSHRESAVPSCDQVELGSDGCPSCGTHLLPVQHKSWVSDIQMLRYVSCYSAVVA